jgi:phosphohistidine phosphatase
MRRLMLWRHAKTETDAPSGQDRDRRLDERGRRDAAEIGGWIGAHPPFPDLVLVSTAVRAQQTWDLAWQVLKDRIAAPRIEHRDELYGAEPTDLLKIVRLAEAQEAKQLMLVGHNPGMHELAMMLAGSGDKAARKAIEDNLPTAGLAVLDFDVDDWTDIGFRRGKLTQFVSPKLLRQESGD